METMTGNAVNQALWDVTVALGAEALVLGGLASDEEDGADQIEEALTSGRAAEVFGRMVAALGGPGDFVDRYPDRLPAARVVRDVPAPRAGFVTGADGFDAALWDLRRHQSAVFAALQPALLALVEDLEPNRIDAEIKSRQLMGNRKSRSWDEFVARWDIKTASENGILDEFIRLFAQAYRKAKDREGMPD